MRELAPKVTEGEKKSLIHCVFILSLRLFATQKSTSLVGGRQEFVRVIHPDKPQFTSSLDLFVQL